MPQAAARTQASLLPHSRPCLSLIPALYLADTDMKPAMIVDGNGRIIVAASYVDTTTGLRRPAVARLTPDGAIDTYFGNSGYQSLTSTAFTGHTAYAGQFTSVVVVNDGSSQQIVAGGFQQFNRYSGEITHTPFNTYQWDDGANLLVANFADPRRFPAAAILLATGTCWGRRRPRLDRSSSTSPGPTAGAQSGSSELSASSPMVPATFLRHRLFHSGRG